MGGKTSAKSKNTWISKAYDRINLTVAKGKKDTIQAHAEAQGESVNGFINRAIDNQISQDRNKGPSEALQGPPEGEKVYLPSEREKAQETAQNGEEAGMEQNKGD